MKMAGLCWLSVVLTFVLSAGDTVTAVDQNWLTSIVEGIKNQYPLRDAFTLAVNVPENQDPNELQQVLQDDPADQVKRAISQDQVYRGTRVVAAGQSEAVSRVLENIDSLTQSSQGNFLIIYSSESPCGPGCTNTNEDGIADKINDVTQKWSGYAFAFSNVVDVPDVSTSQMAESFQQLPIAKMGLDNIFRCYDPGDGAFQCTSCSSGGAVAPSCVANTPPSTQEEGAGEETGVEQVDTVDTGGISGGDRELMGEGKPGRVSGGKRCGGRKGSCKRRGGKGRRGGGRQRKGGKVRKGHKQRRMRKGKGWGKGRGKGMKGWKGRGWGKGRGKGMKGWKGKGWGKGRGKGMKGWKGRGWGKRRGKGMKGWKGKGWGKRRGKGMKGWKGRGWGKRRGKGMKGWKGKGWGKRRGKGMKGWKGKGWGKRRGKGMKGWKGRGWGKRRGKGRKGWKGRGGGKRRGKGRKGWKSKGWGKRRGKDRDLLLLFS